MFRSKRLLVSSLFIFSLSFIIFLPELANADSDADSGSTFPVDKAGIAAYVEIKNIEDINIDALVDALEKDENYIPEEVGETYTIGKVKVENEVESSYPHVYVGLDGWMVAYYLKEEEASRIMQWKGYSQETGITTTTLEDAINYMCNNLGLTCSTPVKYYDFAYPEANKITLVAEESGNDFYVTVPGELKEASYGIIVKERCCSGLVCQMVTLKIDEEETVYSKGLGCGNTCSLPFVSYGYYDLSDFSGSTTAHHVVFNPSICGGAAQASVFIYKN